MKQNDSGLKTTAIISLVLSVIAVVVSVGTNINSADVQGKLMTMNNQKIELEDMERAETNRDSVADPSRSRMEQEMADSFTEVFVEIDRMDDEALRGYMGCVKDYMASHGGGFWDDMGAWKWCLKKGNRNPNYENRQ